MQIGNQVTCAPNQGCSGSGVRSSSADCGSVRRVYCSCEAGVRLRANDAVESLKSLATAPGVLHCKWCALDGGK